MGAGGSADAMKFSDVLILVGVGVLCAGFIIHGWVETTSIGSDEETPMYGKALTLLKGDEVQFDIEATSDCSGSIVISDDSVELENQTYQLMKGEKFSHTFDSKDSQSYSATIYIDGGEAEVNIDVKRVFMLDFIIYPIGIAILLFGLQKRRVEQESAPIDAEI